MQCAYHNLLAVLLILLLIKIGVRTMVSWTRERSNKHLIDFIRNGTDASPNQYPFFVGLHVRTYGLVCGGTLVRPLVILTVSTCCHPVLQWS
jgi:secreted trypsin-like serine protease